MSQPVDQRRYVKWVIDLQLGVWVPVRAIVDCNDYWIKSRDNLTVRETTDVIPDANSAYDIIQPGIMQFLPVFQVVSLGLNPLYGTTRFRRDDLISHLSADTDPTTVVVTFVL